MGEYLFEKLSAPARRYITERGYFEKESIGILRKPLQVDWGTDIKHNRSFPKKKWFKKDKYGLDTNRNDWQSIMVSEQFRSGSFMIYPFTLAFGTITVVSIKMGH